MNFKELLSTLADKFGNDEFTSNDAYYLINHNISSPKVMSNRLAKLYFMGFLKRKRVKRDVIASNGKECKKGYCYLYSISSQGWKYLNYIANKSKVKPKDENLKVGDFNSYNNYNPVNDISWEIFCDVMVARSLYSSESLKAVLDFIKRKYKARIISDNRLSLLDKCILLFSIDNIR